MPSSRRTFLKLIGGGVVLAAGASTAFVTTRTPAHALAPWGAAGQYDDPRMRALSYAILAPNPHNRQPWQARLDWDDTVTLFRDPELNLPHTDPYDRQLTIGMGCFIEQFVLAAGLDGFATDVTLFPQGEGAGDPTATLTLRPGAAEDPLATQMPYRRSCKEPFDASRPVEASALSALADLSQPNMAVFASDEAPVVAALKDLTWQAWVVEAETPHTYKESVDLMRIGKAEINAQPDGIDMGGALFEILSLLGQFDREVLLDTSSTAYQQGFAIYKDMLAATPAYVWLTSPGNSRVDQIAAGRSWLRVNLTTTALGLSLHPVSQCLQEYPEMAPHYATAHSLLAQPGETVQMLGRVGYGPEVPITPRWPVEAKLIDPSTA
ncbi:MAG: twin-arginine translocation pathway signal protein [Pseudomonadota bacterium]